jgi:hypothetical protein
MSKSLGGRPKLPVEIRTLIRDRKKKTAQVAAF